MGQKGGKDSILEEEFEFKGIEEDEEEECYADMDMKSAEGDKDKGEERHYLSTYFGIFRLFNAHLLF